MPNLTAFLSYVLIANFAPGANTIIAMSNVQADTDLRKA